MTQNKLLPPEFAEVIDQVQADYAIVLGGQAEWLSRQHDAGCVMLDYRSPGSWQYLRSTPGAYLDPGRRVNQHGLEVEGHIPKGGCAIPSGGGLLVRTSHLRINDRQSEGYPIPNMDQQVREVRLYPSWAVSGFEGFIGRITDISIGEDVLGGVTTTSRTEITTSRLINDPRHLGVFTLYLTGAVRSFAGLYLRGKQAES